MAILGGAHLGNRDAISHDEASNRRVCPLSDLQVRPAKVRFLGAKQPFAVGCWIGRFAPMHEPASREGA